ncbi:hypothetical protein P7C73_g1328, partial [Tremellales sp. Uapishka_1]
MDRKGWQATSVQVVCRSGLGFCATDGTHGISLFVVNCFLGLDCCANINYSPGPQCRPGNLFIRNSHHSIDQSLGVPCHWFDRDSSAANPHLVEYKSLYRCARTHLRRTSRITGATNLGESPAVQYTVSQDRDPLSLRNDLRLAFWKQSAFFGSQDLLRGREAQPKLQEQLTISPGFLPWTASSVQPVVCAPPLRVSPNYPS